MDGPEVEALLPERDRFCVACLGPVGRGRDGRPGRLRGTCPWCHRAFDLRPHLDPGTVLDGRRAHWRVTGPLAHGGRAWLHRVVVEDPDRACAGASRVGGGRGPRGVVTRVRGRDDEAGVVAATEPEALMALAVPGLVGVRDVVDGPGGERHLVLEHVDGDPPRPPLSDAAAARRVLGAVPAVAGLHAAGLLHADLKPAHLLAGPGGVTVVDLGGVRRIGDRTTPVWGTEGFLAPEIVPGGTGPSPASDVWALGAVLATLVGGALAGRPERVGRSGLADTIAAATRDDPRLRPGPAALADALTADLAALPRTGDTPPGG